MTILRQSVTLNPGQSKAVDFQFTPSRAKAYSVSVNGLAGSFNAIEAAPTTRLFGNVTDINTGAPIVGVYGIVYQDYNSHTDDYNFTTDAQGHYEIRDMLFEVDVTQMVIYAAGYQTYTDENVSIQEGDNLKNVQMRPE